MAQPPQPIPGDVPEPNSTLGLGFWALWLVAMLAISAAFVAAMAWVRPQMDTALGITLGAATVLLFTSLLVAGGWLPARLRQNRGAGEKMRAPYRRYMLRFMPAMFGYVILLLLAVWYAAQAQPTGVLAWIIAIAPSLPLMLAIRAIFLLPREEDDEYQRERLYRAYAWATGATLAICTVWGFLDGFGVVAHAEMWLMFPIWTVCMGLARCLPTGAGK